MYGVSRNLQRPSEAWTFLVLYLLCVLVANLIVFSAGSYSVSHLIATATLLLGCYPMWRYLDKREESLPFFPIITLLYGLYYGVMPFTPFEPYYPYLNVPKDSLIKAGAFSSLGLAVLVVGYYGRPQVPTISRLPRLSVHWSSDRARQAAVLLGMIGVGAEVLRRTVDVPPNFDAIVYFLQQLSLLGSGILFYLWLQGRLALPHVLFLCCGLVPLQVLSGLSTGFTFPVIRLVVFLGMIYVAVRRRIPWRVGAGALLVLIALMGLKQEYRELEWSEGRPEAARSASDVARRGLLFGTVVAQQLRERRTEAVGDAFEIVTQRMDLLNVFAYLIKLTPEHVPYLGGASYSDVLWKFVPRIAYPGKPSPRWGNEFGQRYALLSPADDVTSVNLPQMIEMYINFGLTGLIIGMWVLAQLYRALAHTLNHHAGGEWGTVSAAVVLSSLVNIESNLLLVFGSLIQWVVLLYLLGFWVREPRIISTGVIPKSDARGSGSSGLGIRKSSGAQ